jgi:hypothetical protein
MRIKRKLVNLYNDATIYSIKRVISIASEEDLNQFWDYLQNSSNATYELTLPFITDFYNFTLSYLYTTEYQFFEIILEESDKNLYFTLWNEKIALMFKKHINKSPFEYLHNSTRITIKLNKLKLQKKKQKKKLVIIPTRLEPYTFLEAEDLDELLKLTDDMQEIIFNAKRDGLLEEYFISLRSIFSMFCLTLRYYKEIRLIANTITEFSNLINVNKEKFIELTSDELDLVTGFINNIDNWVQTLFVKGGAELHFMDNSLQADYEMISQIITPQEEENLVDLDGIFDF